MTLADADNIAARIIALPKLYDNPRATPDFVFEIDRSQYASGEKKYAESVYPWLRKKDGYFWGDSSFFDGGSFGSMTYTGEISEWEETISQSIDPSARYITIDDLRMMPYVGIEYARAKILYGWRYTYRWDDRANEGSFEWIEGSSEAASYVPELTYGYIVRDKDGRRYIRRKEPDIDGPEPIPDPTDPRGFRFWNDFKNWDYRFWTPMHRMPGFQSPTTGFFTWREDVYIPSEPISNRIYFLEWIEGDDDILNIAPISGTLDIGVPEEETMIRSGGMEIVICPIRDNGDDSFDAEKSIVGYQQRVYPFYKDFWTLADYRANNSNYTSWNHKYWEEGNWDEAEKKEIESMVRQVYEIDYNAGMVPLKKGVTYGVYARFDNTEVVATESRRLCSYIRTPTRTTAPFMWKSKHHIGGL